MRIVSCTCLLSIAAISVAAQATDSVAIRNYYNEHAILLTGNWNKYIQNNKTYPLKQMGEVVKFSPEAFLEYNKYKQNRTVTVSLLAVSAGLLTSSLLVTSREAKIGLAAGAVVTATISLPFSKAWVTHLNKSVWIHNRDILLR